MYYFFSLAQYSDWALLVLRVAIGAIFLAHGAGKWKMWKMTASEQLPKGMLNLMRFLSLAEPLGGLAMLVGFLTPLAAIGLGLVMLGAIYLKIFKWKIPFSATDKLGWEFDLLILAAAFAVLVMGAGAYSVDWWWF